MGIQSETKTEEEMQRDVVHGGRSNNARSEGLESVDTRYDKVVNTDLDKWEHHPGVITS